MSLATAALFASSLIAGTAVAHAAASGQPIAPAAKVAPAPAAAAPVTSADLELIEKHCSSCHSADQVTARNRTAAEWAETIDRMVNYGAQLSPEDNKRITDFLVAHYGDKTAK